MERCGSGMISADSCAIDITAVAVKTEFIVLSQAESLLQRGSRISGIKAFDRIERCVGEGRAA